MQIIPLASTFTDNFFYLIVDGTDAVLIDPIDAQVAIAAVRELDVDRVRIVTTHGHPDHAGGNETVKDELGCEVLAPEKAEMWPVDHDIGLLDGDKLPVGDTIFDVIHAPGHTDDHVVLSTDGHLISGDVYFVGGAGNCRTGDPGVLYRTFYERLGGIPDETLFYPGHDYAKKNLEFCLMIEPDNAHAAELLQKAESWTRDQGPFLTTLGEERSYNPFHRAHTPEVQSAVAERFPDALDASIEDVTERTFRAIRKLRDTF